MVCRVQRRHLHSEDDLVVVGVLGSKAAPKGSKLVIRGPSLTDDLCTRFDELQSASSHKDAPYLAVEPRVVVDLDDARRACAEARLNEVIVFGEVDLVDVTSGSAVGQELPPNGQAEDVVAVVFDKVLHLSCAVHACRPTKRQYDSVQLL